jgi:hypothetical protein
MMTSGSGSSESQREGRDGRWPPFTMALALASGGLDVEIVREGASELGLLSLHEMLGVLATVGDARAKAESQLASNRSHVTARAPAGGAPSHGHGNCAGLIGTAGTPSAQVREDPALAAEHAVDGSSGSEPHGGGLALPRAKPLASNDMTVAPSLRPFLAMVREVSDRRRHTLGQLRDALQRGDQEAAVSLARQLVGLADAAR